MASFFKRCWKFCFRLILAVLGFFIGLGCSLLFYEFVLRETDFDDAYKVLMFLSTALFLSFGFAFSKQMACITLLTFPEFAGRAGRRSIQATLMILMLSGPMKNLGDNGEETLRFLGCIKDMLWDIFMAGVDLVLAPIKHILDHLKASATEIEHSERYNLSVIKDMEKIIQEEIEDDSETLRIKAENDKIDKEMGISERSSALEREFADVPSSSQDESGKVVKSYQKKLLYRCEEIYTKGTESCMQIFQKKFAECTDNLGSTVAWILCWPMKLEFVCNIISGFSKEKACGEVGQLIDQNFGETYVMARKGIDDFAKSFQFRINYQGLTQLINLDAVEKTRDELLEKFLVSKEYVEWYLTMIKRSLTLSYLLVIFSALSYHTNYFRKLSFDNTYISSYFRKIDERRHLQRRHNSESSAPSSILLPFKSFEKSEVTLVRRCWLTPVEWKKFLNQLFCIGMEAGIVFTIFGIDYVFKELLLLLRNHAQIEIKQEGVHVLAVQVTGEGFLARLMRNVVKDFSIRKEIDMKHFTKPCLPEPRSTDPSYYERVIVLFLVLLSNAYFEAHFARFRHCIADYFYPKRYKKRTVWLYNEMLRRRRRKMEHLKRKVLENADKFRRFMPQNPLQLLSQIFPKRCACLKRWKVGRRKCILCLANGSIYLCPRCGFAYCAECFDDVDSNCIYCVADKEERERVRWSENENQEEEDQEENYYDDVRTMSNDQIALLDHDHDDVV